MREGLKSELGFFSYSYICGVLISRYRYLKQYSDTPAIEYLIPNKNYLELMLKMERDYPEASEEELGRRTAHYIYNELSEEERAPYWEADSKLIIPLRKENAIQSYKEQFYKATGWNLKMKEKDIKEENKNELS